MTWIKLDDGFFENPKVMEAGDDAALLYVAGLCYASRNLTDGRIPKPAVPRLTGLKGHARAAKALVCAGLWIESDGRYEIHDYLAYQRSAETVVSQRDAGRDRAKRSRERRANGERTQPARSRTVRAIEVERELEGEHGYAFEVPGGALLHCGTLGSDALRAYDAIETDDLR